MKKIIYHTEVLKERITQDNLTFLGNKGWILVSESYQPKTISKDKKITEYEYIYRFIKKIEFKFDNDWSWDDTNCRNCKFFDVYDICVKGGNYGTVTTEILNNCLEHNYFKQK